MKLTPLALAATLCAFTAHAQQDDDCPSDAQMIATMSFTELDRYEADMRNEEPSFEELCKDATDKDEEEAAGSRRHYCVKRTARYVSASAGEWGSSTVEATASLMARSSG
ncbi:hypothetical protein [Stenotrophomonas forensis]|uniref:hypothetical protein n=1 Tax=Stenotrophomonas forensis TaxID=2871169 RepID=UPI0039C66B37